MLDFALCDINGKVLKPITRRKGASINIPLRARRSGAVSLAFEDPAGPLIDAGRSVVKAWMFGAPLLTGRVGRPSFKGRERNVALPIFDPGFQLSACYVGMNTGGGFQGHVPGSPYRLEGIDQSEIMARLIEHGAPTAAELATGIPSHGLIRGNLTGSRTRDREYEKGKYIQEAIEQLGEVIDGVDWEYAALDREDGVYAQLNTYYPWQGADRSDVVVFEFGCGMNNVADFTWEPAGDLVINRSVHWGQKDETTGTQPEAFERNMESEKVFGIWGKAAGEPDVTIQTTLQEHARADVDTYGWPINYFTIVLPTDGGEGWVRNGSSWTRLPNKMGRPFTYGPNQDFWIGDVIKVIARDKPTLDVELVGRVIDSQINELEQGPVVVELTCSPLVVSGNLVRGVRPPSFIRDFAMIKNKLREFQVVQ